MRSDPSWLCAVQRGCMRYAMNTCYIAQLELYYHNDLTWPYKYIAPVHDSIPTCPSQLFTPGVTTPECLQGIFQTPQELDSYEKMWHNCIYKPAWSELKTEVRECSVCHL